MLSNLRLTVHRTAGRGKAELSRNGCHADSSKLVQHALADGNLTDKHTHALAQICLEAQAPKWVLYRYSMQRWGFAVTEHAVHTRLGLLDFLIACRASIFTALLMGPLRTRLPVRPGAACTSLSPSLPLLLGSEEEELDGEGLVC